MPTHEEIVRRVTETVTAGLNWPTSSRGIDPDTPLGAEGLGLDSVLVIELAVLIERDFDITLDDEAIPALADKSIREIATQIQEQIEARGVQSGVQ